mmetsp:Transcript_93496/g.171275  ORF Transcript_93496/g.171275 Transcript_93496/m.171275 type:complete len:88 (+) Transcript_93496:1035-1298(+)
MPLQSCHVVAGTSQTRSSPQSCTYFFSVLDNSLAVHAVVGVCWAMRAIESGTVQPAAQVALLGAACLDGGARTASLHDELHGRCLRE